MKSFRFDVPMWMEHLPGQHYDVRLTAPDGYRAQRSYSIASSPLDVGEVELTIDLLDDGEVSPYFHEVVEVGDQVELRGPFTSYFVWRGESPVLLVGGGSGVVPLMSMLRHKRRTMPELDMRLVYSVRYADDVIYAGRAGRRRGAHLHARGARGLDRPHGPHRRRAAPRAGGRRAARVRVRLERLRRDRERACCSTLGMEPARFAPSATADALRLMDDHTSRPREVIRRLGIGERLARGGRPGRFAHPSSRA